ncbi:MAG: Rid family detoxifying hydrolase [Desulfopila sp.]|jgi:2-iminobutanoate/2-iminopropanoate deaminase|nr:Rid family detoxifying hydrolase [Desulfopila sp.]
MQKEVIYTDKAPEPGPYSQAIKYGNLIFVSGQTSEDAKTGKPVHDSVAAQTRRILKNIKAILEAAGSDLEKVLRVDIYLSSMEHKDELNSAYLEFFPKDRPARNCVGVRNLDDGLDVEIEVIAGV